MTDTTPWVPVALSTSIEPATSAGTRIDGVEYVVWRDDEGKPHVWEDRCPHRGMRLSFGFVRGDQIACLYHGWRYDSAGQCRHIPAHPDLDVPKTIKVPTFAVAEAGGLIWMAPSESADQLSLPALPNDLLSVRSLYVDASLEFCRDQLATNCPPHMAEIEISVLSPFCLQLDAGDKVLVIALQPVATDRTALHVLASGQVSTEARVELAIWTAGLRFMLEHSFAKAA
ncbi:Rieske (2Fe-2S) protein [Rhizobium sp. SL42]|uniref:Rieske (2Fe-2S) protein n=1 Tax=Rhizobium sp. SL42 TaxID=2806346 RepID=UPI001F429485|nr:Rieske (2Fe-2S) protein [Rhizobium sp. SL42]UJW74798.1 Rieske (2Fe-2S) protein [Rhizobium sp. SL42]